MAADPRRYFGIVALRVGLAVSALLTASWAGHIFKNTGSVWLLASVLAASAAALLIWPLVVPARNRTMTVYSLGHAFLLAGIFLLPPAALVVAVTFAITLAGMVTGTRAYRTVFQLSTAILAYGGFALIVSLGPRPTEVMYEPALRAGLELLIAAAALVLLLLIRSIALRVEQGADTPRWGAFQPAALAEAVFCLVYAVSITVLARIHLLLLGVVYAEIGALVWFLHRYRVFALGPKRIPEEAPALVPIEGRVASPPLEIEEEWEDQRRRRAR
jgi:hypothetical protein